MRFPQRPDGACPLDNPGVVTVTAFAAAKRYVDGVVVQLDLAGEVRGAGVYQLVALICDVIVDDVADELIIDLDAVNSLDPVGVWVLICGYEVTMECGIVYRVLNPRGQARQALQAAGMLEVLADSEDVGAMLLALASLPDPNPGTVT